jgi:hypothetical protein
MDEGRWKKQRCFRSYGIYRPKNNDQQNAEFHDREGPEFDGAEGNRGNDYQRNEDEFNEMVKYSH